MADQIIIGASHMKAEIGYGDQADLTSPSQRKGDVIKRSKVAKSLLPAAPIVAGAGDFQVRKVSSEQKVPTTPGMRNPNASPARVPLSNVRRANDGLFRATKR